MDQQHFLLGRVFGYPEFRDGQEPLVNGILSGRDVLGIMPTGGGKSLCYQLPALMLPGITLVVSPLISLMADQVMALKAVGVPAAFINSTLSLVQLRLVFRNIQEGKYKIIYVAPERLDVERFLETVGSVTVSMVTVDEAHCISQWGQDFRPSYLKISDFIEKLPTRPIVSAFTATATEQVRSDIVRILKLQNPLRIVTGFDRPNLYYEVVKPKNKLQKLLELVRQRKTKSGIVYCATRKEVENVCIALKDAGFAATRYHAGLPEEERAINQNDFLYDRSTIMVATNAFGMGIDKSNVAFVIHYNMPKSLESYYQEAGRAGRDGTSADCILLFSAGDIRTARFLIENSSDNEALTPEERKMIMQQDLARLDTMVGYCKTKSCLRGYILSYFGQHHDSICNSCGNCSADLVEQDITVEAKKILSCVYRISSALGYSLGPSTVAKVLRGSKDKRISELRLDALPTYAIMAHTPQSELCAMIDWLEDLGYLSTDIRYGAISLTASAKNVLYHGESVSMRVEKKKGLPPKLPAPPKDTSGFDEDLYDVLRALRTKLATQERVPAYVVFSNAALQDMARKAPVTQEQFLRVSGVGAFKAEKYGKIFVEEIQHWTRERKT